MPPKKKGHGCLIAFIIVLVIFLVGVGSCGYFFANYVLPIAQTELKVQQEVGVKNATFKTTGGHTTWVVTVEPGFDNAADANVIACKVKSDLAGTQSSNDTIQIVDDQGTVLATAALCR
jgi:hypothetical protein